MLFIGINITSKSYVSFEYHVQIFHAFIDLNIIDKSLVLFIELNVIDKCSLDFTELNFKQKS